MAIQGRLQAVKKVRVYEEIVSQITALILDGDLKPGDKLPSERELCERFGVGRNSVREAVRALESVNLVVTRQGEGTYVTAGPEHLVPVVSEKLSGGEEGIRDLFEARRILEPQVTALAAGRATKAEIAKLQEIIVNQRAEIAAARSGIAEDTAFHLMLAEAAKNEFLHRLVATLLSSLSEARERSVGEHSVRVRSVEGHQRILDAIRAGDTKGASARMLSHLLDIEGREMGLTEHETTGEIEKLAREEGDTEKNTVTES